jgi:membrane-bound lytic murein transglycosylase A
VRELLDQNPRMVFFRELPLDDAAAGPIGTLGVALTPGISVAVDPRYLPLGAPLLIQITTPANGQESARIAVAQDTGGAIHGALRIDWFMGQGPEAAQIAGSLRAHATVRLFVPRGVAPQNLL